MTVRVLSPDTEAAGRKAAEVLRREPGVLRARAVDRARAAELLSPWFGDGPLPEDLPLPRLVELDTDRDSPPTAAALQAALGAAGLQAEADDHRRWADSVLDAAHVLRLGSLAVLALLAMAAAATVSFAARAGLEARRDIVEALHLVGAQDSYIARLFELRFLGLGLRAGLLGALLAACGAVGIVLWLRGSGAAALLVGDIPLRALDLAALAPAPLAAGLIGMWTARASVMGALKRLD
jgi:cell division transport system permease protein